MYSNISYFFLFKNRNFVQRDSVERPQVIPRVFFFLLVPAPPSVHCPGRTLKKNPAAAPSVIITAVVQSPRLHHQRQEVAVDVPPPALLGVDDLAVGRHPDEHVLVLVAPHGRRVRVVLVLLDALDQPAVRTVVPLRGR